MRTDVTRKQLHFLERSLVTALEHGLQTIHLHQALFYAAVSVFLQL